MTIVRITMSVAACMVDLIVAHASMNVSMQSYIFAFYRKHGHIYIYIYIYIYTKMLRFSVKCLPDVPKALALYDTYSKLDIEFDKKFGAMENELHKGIGHHLAKCFEAANLVVLENNCKKLQTCVEDLSMKINSLTSSNKTLQMEIESTSKSLNATQTTCVPMSPFNPAMRIVDELSDRDRRKKNVIVYNLPEPAQNNKSDSDAFSALCCKNLVSELKNRRLKGEKDLVIRNGAIVTKPAARSNTPANSTTVPMASNQHS